MGVLNRCVYGLKRLLFFLELHQAFVLIYFSLKQKIEKVSIFLKKYHGLTSFESCKFCPFFESMFLYSKKAFFLNSPAKILTCLRLDWSWGVIISLTKKSKFLKTNFRTVFVVSQTHGKKLKSKFLLVVDYGSKLVNFICARTNAINLGIPYLTSLSLSSPTPKVCTDGQCTPQTF